jgi:hypothetical protein
VVATFREKLTINKQAAQKYDVERLNIRKVTELEIRKLCHIKISNTFAALEYLSDSKDINRDIKENIKI